MAFKELRWFDLVMYRYVSNPVVYFPWMQPLPLKKKSISLKTSNGNEM